MNVNDRSPSYEAKLEEASGHGEKNNNPRNIYGEDHLRLDPAKRNKYTDNAQ